MNDLRQLKQETMDNATRHANLIMTIPSYTDHKKLHEVQLSMNLQLGYLQI